MNLYAKCKECRGAGENINRHYSGNPALETSHYCCECAGTGKVLISFDPITELAKARKMRRSSAFRAQRYGEIRQRVVSPVFIP